MMQTFYKKIKKKTYSSILSKFETAFSSVLEKLKSGVNVKAEASTLLEESAVEYKNDEPDFVYC